MKKEMIDTTKNGIKYFYYPPWEKNMQVGLGFSSRCGGVSEDPYDELNLGYKWGDKHAAVAENRRRFLALWDKEEQDLVCGEQVHGTKITLVREKKAGALIPATDGLITTEPDIVLGAFSADCLLIYLWDPDARAIGLVHAGWRGTLGGILYYAVEAMQQRLGACPGRIQALFAPCIGSCCYEIGRDVMALAAGSYWGDKAVFYPSRKKGHAFLDLQKTNQNILVSAGMQPGNIGAGSLCTHCNPRLFYSYRRATGQATGSHMGIIFLSER